MTTHGVIKHGCRRRIGDGNSTKVWKVSWLSCPINGYLSTPMLEVQQFKILWWKIAIDEMMNFYMIFVMRGING